MSAEVISSDIANIQDEDLLRRMWQQTEDVGRKKEIRSHMFNLREGRLQEYHSSTDELHFRSIPGSAAGSRRESLTDESSQTRRVLTPETSAKAISEPPVIREETYTLCKSADGMDCKARSKSMIAHESGRSEANGGSDRSIVRNEDSYRTISVEAGCPGASRDAEKSSRAIVQEKVVTEHGTSAVHDTKISSRSESSAKTITQQTAISEEQTVSGGQSSKTSGAIGELISRKVESPDANTVIIRETRKLPDGRTITSTRTETKNENVASKSATSMSSAMTSAEIKQRHAQTVQTKSSHEQIHKRESTGKIEDRRPEVYTTTRAVTQEAGQIRSSDDKFDSAYKDTHTKQQRSVEYDHEARTDSQTVDQKLISHSDDHELLQNVEKSKFMSRTVDYPDANTKVIKEVRSLPDGSTFTKTFVEKQNAQKHTQKNARKYENVEHNIQQSKAHENYYKRDERGVAQKQVELVDKKIEYPNEYTRVITETRILPDGRKEISKHTEIKSNEKPIRDHGVSGITSTVVDRQNNMATKIHKSGMDSSRSVSTQQLSTKRLVKREDDITSHHDTTDVSRHQMRFDDTFSDLTSKERINKPATDVRSEKLIDLRNDIRVNEVVTDKLTSTPYDDSFSSSAKNTSIVKKDLSADVELIDVDQLEGTRPTTVPNKDDNKSEKLIVASKHTKSHQDYADKPQNINFVQDKKTPKELLAKSIDAIPQKNRISEDISATHHAFASSLRADGVFVPGRKSPGSTKVVQPNNTMRSDSPANLKPKHKAKTPMRDTKTKKPISSPSKTGPDYTLPKVEPTASVNKTYSSKPIDKSSKQLNSKRYEPQIYNKEPKTNGTQKSPQTKHISDLDKKHLNQDGDSSPTTTVSELEFFKPDQKRDLIDNKPHSSNQSYEPRYKTPDSQKTRRANVDHESIISSERVNEENDRKSINTNTYKSLYGKENQTLYTSESPRKVKYIDTILHDKPSPELKTKDTVRSYIDTNDRSKSTTELLARERSSRSPSYGTSTRGTTDREYSEETLQFTPKIYSASSSPERDYCSLDTLNTKAYSPKPSKRVFATAEDDLSYQHTSKFTASRDNSPTKFEYEYTSSPRKLEPTSPISPTKSQHDYYIASGEESPSPKYSYRPPVSPTYKDSSFTKPEYDSKVGSPGRSSPTKPKYYGQSTSPLSTSGSPPTKSNLNYRTYTPDSQDISGNKIELSNTTQDTIAHINKPLYNYSKAATPKLRDNSPAKIRSDEPKQSLKQTGYSYISGNKTTTYKNVDQKHDKTMLSKSKDVAPAKIAPKVSSTRKISNYPSQKPIQSKSPSKYINEPKRNKMSPSNSRDTSPCRLSDIPSSRSPFPADSAYKTMDEMTFVHTTKTIGDTKRSSPDGSPERSSVRKESYTKSSEMRDDWNSSFKNKFTESTSTKSQHKSPVRNSVDGKIRSQDFISHHTANLYSNDRLDKRDDLTEKFSKHNYERTPEKINYTKPLASDISIHAEYPYDQKVDISHTDFSKSNAYNESLETKTSSTKHKYYSSDKHLNSSAKLNAKSSSPTSAKKDSSSIKKVNRNTSKIDKENDLNKQKKVQHRTTSAPVSKESNINRKYTSRTYSDNVQKVNDQNLRRQEKQKSDLKIKQEVPYSTLTSSRVLRNEKLSKETARLVKNQEKLVKDSHRTKSPKYYTSPSRPEKLDKSHEDTTKRDRPKIRKFPNLDEENISSETKYIKSKDDTTRYDNYNTLKISDIHKSTTKSCDRDKTIKFIDIDEKSSRDTEQGFSKENKFLRGDDKVTKFISTAEQITKPLNSGVTSIDAHYVSDKNKKDNLYNVSSMVNRFSERSFTEELEKDADEIETDYQYKFQLNKDNTLFKDRPGVSRNHSLFEKEELQPFSTSRRMENVSSLRSTEAVKKAKQLFENIIQQESTPRHDDEYGPSTWDKKRTFNVTSLYEKESYSPDLDYKKESSDFISTTRKEYTDEMRSKSTSLKDIYDINEKDVSEFAKSDYSNKLDKCSLKSDYYNNEKNTKLTREADEYTSRSGSRGSEHSVSLSKTGSPRNAVKFGVTLRRTDSDKRSEFSPKANEPLIFPPIEDTFDIKVLEEMLETTTSYDVRRKIRAQIRFLKRNDTRTKTSVSKTSSKNTSPVRMASARSDVGRSKSMRDKTEYQDSYCSTNAGQNKHRSAQFEESTSSRSVYSTSPTSPRKYYDGNVLQSRGDSPQRTCSRQHDSSSPRSLSPDNKTYRKAHLEHLWSAKTMSSSLKERPRIRKSSADHQDEMTRARIASNEDSEEHADAVVYRTLTTKEYSARNHDEPVRQMKTQHTSVISGGNGHTDINKSRDKYTPKTKIERKTCATQKSSSDKQLKNIRNVTTKGKVAVKNGSSATSRTILEPSTLTSAKIVKRGNVAGFSESRVRRTDETNQNEKHTRFTKTDYTEDPMKRLFRDSPSPTRGAKSTVYHHESVDEDGNLVTSYTIKTTGSSTYSDHKDLTSDFLENIWDEEVLNSLLEECDTYEERRRIRSRLRQVMAEQKEHMAEGSKSLSSGGNVITQKTSVTSRTSSSVSSTTSQLPNKPISPFAKFRQLDKQHSLNSPPSTPKTPGTGSGGVLFKFTDSELARSASSVKDRLLYWAQVKTKEYENIKIENFSTSWADGLAFCALIHHFLPDAFDYHKLNPKNRRYNFTLAFRVADEKAGIAPLLDVEDMVMMRKPDWKCVFTYVQAIYRRFKDED